MLQIRLADRSRVRVRSHPPTIKIDWLDDVVSAPRGVAGVLCNEVAKHVVNGQLDGGQRDRLIRRASYMGVSRFDANLIIAAALNRVARPVSIPSQTSVEIHTNSTSPQSRGVLKWVLWIVGVEALSIGVVIALMLR